MKNRNKHNYFLLGKVFLRYKKTFLPKISNHAIESLNINAHCYDPAVPSFVFMYFKY